MKDLYLPRVLAWAALAVLTIGTAAMLTPLLFSTAK